MLADDLIATGGTARAAVRLIERSGAHVPFACFIIELPAHGEISGRDIRRPRAVIEAEETAKGAPVHDVQRRLRIRQTVERLDHRHLEHEDRVHRRAPALPAPALPAIGTIERRIQLLPATLAGRARSR